MENKIMETIVARRSTRKYLPEVPAWEKIEEVIKAGRYAPSGGNSQSCHFICIANGEVLEELKEIVKTAFAGMEYDENTYKSIQNSIRLSKKGTYDFIYKAPVLIVVANKIGYGNAMADSSCALMNMMLAAESVGLGSCWINQLHWLDENPIVREKLYALGMKEDETVCGALSLGIPAIPAQPSLERTGNPVDYIK